MAVASGAPKRWRSCRTAHSRAMLLFDNGGGVYDGNTMRDGHPQRDAAKVRSGNGGAIWRACAGGHQQHACRQYRCWQRWWNLRPRNHGQGLQHQHRLQRRGWDADDRHRRGYNNDGGEHYLLRLMAGNTVGNAAVYNDCTGTLNVDGRNLNGGSLVQLQVNSTLLVDVAPEYGNGCRSPVRQVVGVHAARSSDEHRVGLRRSAPR